MTISELLLSIVAVVAAALLSAGITWAIRPWLLRHALARPNARSSHRIPTPQGAGIAVIAATLLVAGTIAAYAMSGPEHIPLAIFAATLFIAIVGFADDVKSIPVLPRLMLQAARRRARSCLRRPAMSGSFRPARSGSSAACFCSRASGS